MAHALMTVGMISIVLGALSGFAVLSSLERPERLARLGIRSPRRVLQLHLDWIIMGILMVVVGLAAPTVPIWVGTLVLFGGVVNPATFIPMTFGDAVLSSPTFRVISYVSFCSLTLGLAAVAYLVAVQ